MPISSFLDESLININKKDLADKNSITKAFGHLRTVDIPINFRLLPPVTPAERILVAILNSNRHFEAIITYQ